MCVFVLLLHEFSFKIFYLFFFSIEIHSEKVDVLLILLWPIADWPGASPAFLMRKKVSEAVIPFQFAFAVLLLLVLLCAMV